MCLQGVIDITTSELADYQVGGEMPCDRYRLEASIEKGIPLVVSVGALDMVNFGAMYTVPEELRRRKLYVHNLTLVRLATFCHCKDASLCLLTGLFAQ